MHLEGLSRDQGDQTSSGLPFRRWRKVCSQGCSPLRPDPDRCVSSEVLRIAAGGRFHFRLTVSTDLATLCTASPFCFWRRFFRGSGRLDAKNRAPACSPPHRSRHLCRIFIAPLRCAAQTSSNHRIAMGLRTRRPCTGLPVSLAVFRVRGYPWSRHYTSEGARMRRIGTGNSL